MSESTPGIKFEIRDRGAVCECTALIERRPDRVYDLSTHLRAAHGFGPDKIRFVTTGEVICPRVTYLTAVQP